MCCVTVVPIQSMHLFVISADGYETMVDYQTVTLTDTPLTDVEETGALTRRSGVACVASVNGSLSPPVVRLRIGNTDVTGMFVSTEQSRILEDPEALGGLGIYYSESNMSYVTALPETSWDGEMLICLASKDGFQETVYAVVDVRCTYSDGL